MSYLEIRTKQLAAWSKGLVYLWQYGKGAKYTSAGTDPAATDDHTKGYKIGDLWHRTGNNKFWVCTKVAQSAAVWASVN